MSVEDIRYYERRLEEERARAEVEENPHLRGVHEQFARAIEWRLRRIKKTIASDRDRSHSFQGEEAAS
ncbi:MAG: hypothetical protein J7493_00075 [Porphyrobacter sp.]|nr:hypothetical protein [Porphyrobacter sp.]